MFSENTIVKGERFQQLADIYLGYDFDFQYNPLIWHQSDKHMHLDSIPSEYNNPPVLFCYAHRLGIFVQKIHYFKNPFILITHNSDENIMDTEQNRYILAHPKLIKWYAQNVAIFHYKLFALPIGIANDQWLHGNTMSIMENLNTPKTKSVYFHFNIETNITKRTHCYNILVSKNIPTEPTVPVREYRRTLAQYEFCICPEGNGFDTHRLWEALYFKCIPIVLRSSHIDILRTQMDIPMIVLDSWDELDVYKLDYNVYNTTDADYYTKLSMHYWAEQIALDVENPKKNITIIPSIIDPPNAPLSYNAVRSVYSKQERFDQTKASIASVKAHIPNNKIMVIECSLLTDEETHYFREHTDIFINLYDHPDKSYIERIHSHSKAMGEGTMTIYALEYLSASNIEYDTLFKLSGRYKLTDRFSYDIYNNDQAMVQYYCEKECASTILYKLPRDVSMRWYAFLQHANHYFVNCYAYEKVFAMFLRELESQMENMVVHTPYMGACGNISVCGGYVEG